MHGIYPGLRHVSWFLWPASREAFRKGTCDLVPNNIGEVPSLMRRRLTDIAHPKFRDELELKARKITYL